MKRTFAILATLAGAVVVMGAPIYPTIGGHEFNAGAYNQDGTIEYMTNGVLPDTLMYTSSTLDHEVSAYWPSWPNQPMLPVWDLNGKPFFGGDFVMGAEFDAQDAPYVGQNGTIDVSLTGRGKRVGSAIADLEIWGTIELDANTVLSGLLWALDLNEVSLYGYSDNSTYVVEGVGTIVGGEVASHFDLVGDDGAVRGHLDFIDRPMGWMTPEYDPLSDVNHEIRADYSLETGWVPEPAAMSLVLVGLVCRRRR